MYYTIYRTINKLDGRYYIGSHKTERLDDDYLGSGKRLRYAVEKYGPENFTKEVLHVFDTPEEMYAREAELVTKEEVENPDCYNLKEGGFGGWDYANSNWKMTEARRKFYSKWGKCNGPSNSKRTRWKKGKQPTTSNWKDKFHTEQTRRKMSQTAKERLKDPTKNSQYGTMWITDGVESKKIKKNQAIPEGWDRGRKMTPR